MTTCFLDPLSFFKCLAQDTRLKILLLLCDQHELCVCDFTQSLQLSQPKVSRHLADLRGCELVVDERRGKWVYYKLNPSLPRWACDALQLTLINNQDYIQPVMDNLDRNTECC